jgi:MYXO-CTERM domain-containing protein
MVNIQIVKAQSTSGDASSGCNFGGGTSSTAGAGLVLSALALIARRRRSRA